VLQLLVRWLAQQVRRLGRLGLRLAQQLLLRHMLQPMLRHRRMPSNEGTDDVTSTGP
jgi:hypothetical protein